MDSRGRAMMPRPNSEGWKMDLHNVQSAYNYHLGMLFCLTWEFPYSAMAVEEKYNEAMRMVWRDYLYHTLGY